MVEKIRETVEYKVTRNHLFTLGKLVKEMLLDGWQVLKCWQEQDGEYITFEKKF